MQAITYTSNNYSSEGFPGKGKDHTLINLAIFSALKQLEGLTMVIQSRERLTLSLATSGIYTSCTGHILTN